MMGCDMFECGTLNETRRAMGTYTSGFDEFLARQASETAMQAQQQAMAGKMWGSLGNIPQMPPMPQSTTYYGTATAEMSNPKIKKEEKGMFQNVKDYIGKHRDMLFTLGLIVVVDHFLFNGALRERIKGSIEGMLKKVEDKFHKDEVN
jgi:hypothetical protein